MALPTIRSSRRSLLAGFSASALVGRSAIGTGPASPDASLINMEQGQRQLSEVMIDWPSDRQLEFQSLRQQLDQLTNSITEAEAKTIDGLRAKARIVCDEQMGDFSWVNDSRQNHDLMRSIVRDIIRIYDPDLEDRTAFARLMEDFVLDRFEHHHWRGPGYHDVPAGQRLAIVGYSHYRQRTEDDFPDFTRWVIENDVLSGSRNIAFFKQIAGYFDGDTDFWNQVIFFNFIPYCIGTDEDRYEDGSRYQIEAGQQRVLRILEEEKPDKLLVFTTKGWRDFPATAEESDGYPGNPQLGAEFPPEFRSGTYRINGHTTRAYGLRHPQGANRELMTKAVESIMSRA